VIIVEDGTQSRVVDQAEGMAGRVLVPGIVYFVVRVGGVWANVKFEGAAAGDGVADAPLSSESAAHQGSPAVVGPQGGVD
jgi:hypothetical protein